MVTGVEDMLWCIGVSGDPRVLVWITFNGNDLSEWLNIIHSAVAVSCPYLMHECTPLPALPPFIHKYLGTRED